MPGEQENQLLLIVKSLTQNRKQKNYLINIQNHNIDKQLNIQNVFVHNYEYVYKLWPCQPTTRQLIKISMFEKLDDDGQVTVVKRGEATPLVKYSYQGERFQFYGSFNQKCVLVLKFRVDTKQNIQEEVYDGQLERMNRSLHRHLLANKDQSLSYKNYLEYTEHLLESFGHQASTPTKEDRLDTRSRKKTSASIYDLKNKNLNIKTEETQQTTANLPQVGTLYSPKNLERQLSKDKYLNSTLYRDSVNLHPQEQSQSSLKKESETSGRKQKLVGNSKLGQFVNKRIDMSSEIKKRRQKYLGQKVEPIIKKPSESPLVSFMDTPNQQMSVQKPVQKAKAQPPNNVIKFSQSFAGKQYHIPHSKSQQHQQPSHAKQSSAKIKKESLDQHPSATKDKQISASRVHKNQSEKEISTDLNVIRAEKFPIGTQRVVQGKQFGSIRRKKTVSNTKSSKKINTEEQLPKNNESQIHEFQPNITHYSIHSKIQDKKPSGTYNLTLFNFKAVLYAGNKTYPKKLVIIFQDSRYSTSVNNCVSLTTEWRQRFGIKNCKENSYISFKLISVGQKQREEGESQVIANDIINCLTRLYRSYFFVDDLAVGYLEFQFEKVESNLAGEGWRRQSQRNSISLPQLKKKNSGPSRQEKRRSSLNREQTSNKQWQQGSKMNIHGSKNKKAMAVGGNLSQNSNIKDKSNYPQKQKLMSKIREKKMQLKAKLK